jgi:hypothetical protein
MLACCSCGSGNRGVAASSGGGSRGIAACMHVWRTCSQKPSSSMSSASRCMLPLPIKNGMRTLGSPAATAAAAADAQSMNLLGQTMSDYESCAQSWHQSEAMQQDMKRHSCLVHKTSCTLQGSQKTSNLVPARKLIRVYACTQMGKNAHGLVNRPWVAATTAAAAAPEAPPPAAAAAADAAAPAAVTAEEAAAEDPPSAWMCISQYSVAAPTPASSQQPHCLYLHHKIS